MKTLKDYLIEEIVATSGNTIGMGNPMPAGEGELGSEPICPTGKCKKEKCKKKNRRKIEDYMDKI